MKNLIFIFSLLLTTTVFAQGYSFRVLANKGQNQIKSGNGATVALKTGATLTEKDQLIAGAGTYIGLMHKSGKTIEVREPGTYTIASLEAKVEEKNVSVASKYAQFIANKMNDDGSVSPLNRMAATGAVSRAVGGAITVLVPGESMDILGDKAVLRWSNPIGYEEGTPYNVNIQNIFDEVIFTESTTENFINLDFNEIENESGLYLVIISTEVNGETLESAKIGIKKVDETEEADLVANYVALKEEVPGDSPMDKLVLASFFEENGMVLDALTKYEEIVQANPEVDDFMELYNAFKIEYQLMKVEE